LFSRLRRRRGKGVFGEAFGQSIREIDAVFRRPNGLGDLLKTALGELDNRGTPSREDDFSRDMALWGIGRVRAYPSAWHLSLPFVAAYRTAAEKLQRGDPNPGFPLGCFPPALPFVGG